MKKALQYILPALLSVLLIWYLFRKVNFHQAMEILSHGVDYWWILAAMVISVFSHIFRAMRWRIQLNALNVETTLMELTCSVFGCYALNLLLPRVGELWRCTFVAKRSDSHFTSVMGSMMAERLTDTVTVLLLTLLTFVLAAPALAAFMAKYPVGEEILKLLYSPATWVCALGAIGVAILIYRRYRETSAISRLRQWTGEIWKGFAVTATMPGKWRFLLLSLAIWGCYFTQLYVAFYAFGFTRALCVQPGLGFGLLPCLVAFVLSAIGMAVPSSGGLGPWNIAVMFGLAVYGVAEVEGAAFSILQWSGQTVMLIILGIFTAIWIGAASSGRSGQHKVR
ncbi:MAG: flippase-like domain-containing protein [Muribaculaceae bacterium]|nr:flippase-like domain-containing protein [Muribaculaceae bacterium]